MSGRPADEAALEQRLQLWLREERGIEGPRRVVRVWDDRILVTKVPAGFAAELLATAHNLPALDDLRALQDAYAEAVQSESGANCVRTWRSAIDRLLLSGLGPEMVELFEDIVIGIESVEAMLDTIFWSAPINESAHAPLPGEVEAYRDLVERLEGNQDLFTRRYGVFEGREVVNYCPAAPLARTILANGWAVITGDGPPF